MSDPIVGIDLGTSNSVVAHAEIGGVVKVLADDGGYKIHPSVVSFHPNGGVVVGAAAKQRKVIDPQNTIYSVKRLIGRAYNSPEVQTAKARSPFQIKEGENQSPKIVTRGGEFAVPEISAIVLDHVRNIASARLGVPVNRAVVTVPASFNDAQRSATATAGAIAGLTVVRVLNEPTAAALAYGNARNLREIIAVYDFGGGTFDITILKLEDQVYEVLGTSGDTFLGGDDLDERLVDRMVTKFLAENRIDLRTNEVSMMRLRAVAEQTKIELSRRSRAVVRIDEIAYGPKGAPLNLQIEISRDEFVKQVSDIIDRTFPVCQEALSLAGVGVDRIADVILVGGTTKIPYVRDQVSKFFGRAPRNDVNPEDAVAAGAALQATALERILSRRTSQRIVVPEPPSDTVTTSDVVELDEQSGAMMAPSELTLEPERPKRSTVGYKDVPARPAPDAKPDTSYSVKRPGVRDQMDERLKTPTEAPPPARTATLDTPRPAATVPPGTAPIAAPLSIPPAAQPLGRITRPVPAVPGPPPTAPPEKKTMFGVPAAPTTFATEVPTEDTFTQESTNPPRPATPPPMPKSTLRSTPGQGALPRPSGQRPAVAPPMRPPPPTAPSEWDDSSQLEASAWTGEDTTAATRPEGRSPLPSPATTQPMAPTNPIAAPTAPTLVAVAPDLAASSTARGMGPAQPQPSTARGIAPPLTAAMAAQAATQVPIAPVAPPQPMRPPVVLEVTPRGLGIGTVAGYCEELIRRNSRLPAEMKRLFTTSRDSQDVVRIVVCQGESRRLDNNTVIGDLVLQGLPPRPRGETSIEVTFSLDASGILQVRARDANTGAEQRASLDLVGGLPQQDVAASRDRIQQLRR